MGYDHQKIEKKWQIEWQKNKLYETQDTSTSLSAGKKRENYYTLVEFAYPSGNLHVGHWYAFAVPDMYARYMRMRGKNVMFPFGFDSFGLPAENAAIKHKLNPREWTSQNIKYMRGQLDTMGNMFDWSREVSTSDPDYYKWTQWLFLQLFKKGLAYQAETAVNWCPSCKTVLANEQVVNCLCERCDNEVEQKQMKQWLLKITDYAERLLDDIDELNWPEPIKEAQRNWIGRSKGTELAFQVKSQKFKVESEIKVFTTRPDTLYGATYMVLAPEHKEISNLKSQITNWEEVEKYIKKSQKKTERQRQENKEKTGVEVKGVRAVNPGSGEEIPIWIADYVLGGVGTGAIMAVPAHDERDFEFAKKFGLPIKQVIAPLFNITEFDNASAKIKETISVQGSYGIIRRKEDDKILIQILNTDIGEQYRLPGGTLEDGESFDEGLMREIKEETGFHFSTPGYSVGYVATYHPGGLLNKNTEPKLFLRTKKAYELWISDGKKGEPSPEEYETEYRYEWHTAEEAISLISKSPWWPDELQLLEAYLNPSATTGEGILVESGEYAGFTSEEARKKITLAVGGNKKTTYRLRDWLVSRQRYWGCPIPLVFCEHCAEKIKNQKPNSKKEYSEGELASPGWFAVSESELPILLPELEDFMPTGDGKSPLAKDDTFVKTKCPKCGGDAERETDTLDTFVDSSWYFLRYTDSHNEKEFASQQAQKKWIPVDFYSGGAEHTTMHLLYSRFFHKALYDLKLVNENEPYVRRMNRGIILGPDGNKMSKSKGNVINPDDVVEKLGADTVRMYLAFIGPYNEVGAYPWSPDGIVGVRRFLERVWDYFQIWKEWANQTSDQKFGSDLHVTVKNVTDSIEKIKFNTGISALMIYLNKIRRFDEDRKGTEIGGNYSIISRADAEIFLKLLAPFAPHITEEIWHQIGNSTSIHLEEWPEYDEDKIQEEEITIVVQVNGKLRGEFRAHTGITEEEATEKAQKLESVKKLVENKDVTRHIYVQDRLLNIVTK